MKATLSMILFKELFIVFKKSSFIWIKVCEKQFLKHLWVSRVYNTITQTQMF